jgi:hypothetical protein
MQDLCNRYCKEIEGMVSFYIAHSELLSNRVVPAGIHHRVTDCWGNQNPHLHSKNCGKSL